ncbi:MAG: hypothetical protein GY941_21990 [Planctomycetes bacterium]|nr:hypothetical protein [Planctomycetota bacterium]
MICQECKQEWVGKAYKRKKGKRVDYRCGSCGCKAKPVVARTLVIPDLHYPFPKEGHLEFLKGVYDKYSCNNVIQLGDLTDGHYESRHATNTGAMNADEEFDAIKPYIVALHDVFPQMKVIRGNHCDIVKRGTASIGISPKWVKSLEQRLLEEGVDITSWEFGTHFIIDGVKYCHGEGRKAKSRMDQDGYSVVQGHWHRDSSVQWKVNDHQKLFAMQLGALIDDEAYAFEYSKHFAKSHKNCGVVVDGVPIIEYMDLGV